MAVDPAGYFYDDDSSDEENLMHDTRSQLPLIDPIELPYPGLATVESVVEEEGTGTAEAPLPTPVISSHEPNALEEFGTGLKGNDWFLLQLPTRLPPLKSAPVSTNSGLSPTGVTSDSSLMPQTQTRVSVPSLRKDRFDNALCGAAPGRLGKLVTYKSGKTILLLEDETGALSVSIEDTCKCHLRRYHFSYAFTL